MKIKSILCACFCVVLAVSCSAPLLTSGSASIVMELGGVFIPPVHSAVADGSRAFIPGATAAIHVSATDQDGATVFNRTIPVSKSTLNVQGMPAGQALNVKVEALDHNDVAICDW
ncbi:MAG TPA: hypothetical protein PLC54_01680, partial [Spirochaetales bacterium]|nr:hypothetical protein [Spirochaetales bacterium]